MQTDALSLQPLRKPLHCPSVDSCPAATELSGPVVNRVVLVGRLTADPELKYMSTGILYTRLGIATNTRPEPEYHDVVIWRRLAEAAGKYLAKGRLVYVEGWLHGRT